MAFHAFLVPRVPAMNRSSALMRPLLHLAICLGLLCAASGCLVDRLGGAYSKEPEDLAREASPETKRLIEQAFAGVDPARLADHHTHMLAIGTSVKDAFVNPKMQSGLNLDRLKFRIYVSATGVKNLANADEEYIARLVRLARAAAPRGKFRILALDKHYNADGSVNLGKTTMYVPNHYVVALAAKYPDTFTPVISIHPYRTDGLQELEKWAKAGIKYVKWLPNAMGMDPTNPVIEPFYRKMGEQRMILLSHAGEEQAVQAEEDQKLGNPLLLRKPLDLGVRVVIAHAASLGECADLDKREPTKANCFDLFLRLMDEPKYPGLLFGEISAMLQFNRMPEPLLTILKRQDLHPRLVNGSDYPLPAINSLIWTRSMARAGFITAEERESLNEIYNYNPLLFDFVLKRILRHPETKQKLASSVFMANPGLEN
jgi:predicted TIM-barrel fold metal-dependent hydrolase